MSTFQQELQACREYAEQGYNLANDSFVKMRMSLDNARDKLRSADRRQGNFTRLENDKLFSKQLRQLQKLQRQTLDGVEGNLRSLKQKTGEFTIVLYGRTMAGKSTLMEILRRGDGSSIGKGAQRTTLDVRDYHWNGLKIYDVPGTCSFGGEQDDKLAFEAAKDADLALFLLTDDAPQPYEAQRLGELKKLGKPVLGIVNVKQVLSPDRTSAKRKLDLRQLDKKIHDQSRLEEIVRQFKEFSVAKGYNFEDVPFVYSHLQSAFFSQREDDDELYRLSNFAAVENFILDKVRSDGKFIRIKTFIDAVARPMQQSIAALYGHSADIVTAWKSYCDKIKQLNKWSRGFVDKTVLHKSFRERTQEKYNHFIEMLKTDMNTQIDNVVDDTDYRSKNAGEIAADLWEKAVTSLKIDERCQNFITQIAEEATSKLRELNDELVQDVTYSGTTFKAPQISLPDVGTLLRDTGSIIGTGIAIAFSGPVGIAITVLSWIFGDSEKEQIRDAKNKLRAALKKSRDEILSGVGKNIKNIIDEKIHREQIDNFSETLCSMRDMLKELAYAQNVVADTLNDHYANLNRELLAQAAHYSEVSFDELKFANSARIVGEEFFIANEVEMSKSSQRKLSALLGEKLTLCTIIDENHLKNAFESLQRTILGYGVDFLNSTKRFSKSRKEALSALLKKRILNCNSNAKYYLYNLCDYVRQNILGCDFSFTRFVEDEANGNMYLIELPQSENFTDKQIQLTQQIFGDPVVLN